MGGPNSGRRRERNACAIEDTVWLDLRLLRRLGFLRDRSTTVGTVSWMRRGEPAGSCRVEVDLRGTADPHLAVTLPGRTPQLIDLERVECPFGGVRFFFVCPRTGARCLVLPLLDGEFASRRAHRITYGSQSEAPLDRLYRRRDKLRDRLAGRIGRDVLSGVRRRRLEARLEAVQALVRRARSDQLRRLFGMT